MSGPDAPVAIDMRKVALAAFVIGGQAEACLLLTIERNRRLLGITAMTTVDAVDRRAAIMLEPEQRADAIHDSQDTNSPAGKPTGLTYELSRRRPIFPGGCPPSIFGAGELNFRVRDGNGWNLSASVTGTNLQMSTCPRGAASGACRRMEATIVVDTGGQAALPNAIQQRASRVN